MREFALPDLSELSPSAAVVGVSRFGERHVAPIGAATDRSVFRIASLTKVFTAVTVVRSMASAGMSLSTPVLDLLPELADSWRAHEDITVSQLLAQTSGLTPGVSGAAAAATGDGDDALRAACALVAEQGSDRAPGQLWEYYNGNYFLAGAVAARLGGGTYEQALEEFALRPAGLRDTTFEAPEGLIPGVADGETLPENGYPRARRPSGGLVSSVPDLLSFVERLLADEALFDVVRATRTRPGDPMSYGFGWAIGPSGQLYLNGRLPGYRTALLVIPKQRLGVVALAADSAALPAVARLLSDVQHPYTRDDLGMAIDAFAA